MPPSSITLPGHHRLSLHALEWSREGPPLLFLHGFGHDAHVWDDVAPRLAPHYRAIALDQRGHGDSDRDPKVRYSHEAVGKDLAAVTSALGPGPFVLVGHSMGGYGALHFAAAQPEALASLVLVDAGPELTSRGVSRLRFDRLAEEPSFEGPEHYERVLARLYPRTAPERRARMAGHWLRRREDGRFVLKLDPAFMRPRHDYDPKKDRGAWAERETAFLWDVLARLECPVLVARGAESPVLVPDTARRMVNVLLEGRLVEIPDAGHPVMLDNPEALADALLDFLVRSRQKA